MHKRYAALRTLSAVYLLTASSLALSSQQLFDLSLEQLLEVKVSTGQLLPVQASESPSAITVIQQNHIQSTSAKNLAELLEIHVPGLMLMAHSEGDKIGLRGNIAAENYKLLLLVNGKNITNMVYEGPMVELDQWDLSDIEKVEVARGPGSVVYGTGAIAGVINIITKAPGKEFNSFNLGYTPEYRSKGFSYQFAKNFGQLESYWFGSYRQTDGLESPNYFIPSPTEASDSRYVGKRGIDSYGPQAYLADSFDRAQIKLHMDIRYREDFKLFARYTQSGQLHHFRTLSPQRDESDNVIDVVDNRKVSLRSLIVAPEHIWQINTKSHLTSALTYDSQEYLRYEQANEHWPEDHYNNVRDYAFSQNRWTASFLYTYEADNWNIISGYEYRNINIGAPWGEDADHIMVREGLYLISDFDTSVYTQDPDLNNRPTQERVQEIGNGLNFETHTHLMESNYSFTPKITLHYSHRIDFPDVSSAMFSPRFALIASPDDSSSITATVQRAQRMMPLRAQYLYDKHNGSHEKEHEQIDSVELAYTFTANTNSQLISRAYYNDIDAVGFTGQDLQLLANIKLAGLEFEATYKNEHLEILANHAFVKPTDFAMNKDLKDGRSRNNISYADYYYITRTEIPITLEDYGSGINNWSENTTKFVLTKKFLNKALTVELNSQIYWDYRGAYDEMRMYQNSYDNYDTSSLSADELNTLNRQHSEFERERALIEKTDAYNTQLNFGASASYLFQLGQKTHLRTTLFAQNLFADRYRYYVNTGSSNYYTNRLNFLQEPKVIGLRLELMH
ncbi:Outer membrane receptor proteins, mostly Fe transport [Alteromonadaceae bacterium Bs31]|nr:Outer membrane receptor proteins, mostly Fe transport [Alteromonadaceae bacterium Bs31]